MPSHIWSLSPEKAVDRPYEYEVRAQFLREAEALLPRLYTLLNGSPNQFTLEDRSKEKAVWLLCMEALDCLRESLNALKEKRHRIPSRLLRTTHEVLDLARYFDGAGHSEDGKRKLAAWYRDTIIDHAEFRKWIEAEEGDSARSEETARHRAMSKFTHRTYHALLRSYSRGKDNRLVHDATALLYGDHPESDTFLVVPQTMAIETAVLAQSIARLVSELEALDLASQEELSKALEAALEKEAVPWRFTTPKEVFERYLRSRRESDDSP